MATPRIHMTAEAYKQLPESLQPTELINGEVIVSPALPHTHQRVVMHLIQILLPFVPSEGELILVDVYHNTTFTSALLQQVIDTNLVFTGVFS